MSRAPARTAPDLYVSSAMKLVVAGASLPMATFSAEELVVAAWRAFPETFGLDGFREVHPDSNRVLSKVMGTAGACAKGWMVQVAVKTYRLTPAGRALAASLRPASE